MMEIDLEYKREIQKQGGFTNYLASPLVAFKSGKPTTQDTLSVGTTFVGITAD